MIARNKLASCLLVAISFSGSLALVGCSDDGLAKRYKVSGTVTYKGEPLKTGEITFMPATAGGRGGSGKIVDGAYSLTTQDPGDGAFPGEYDVLVTSLTIDTGQADADTKKAAEKAKVETVQPDQAAMGNALKNAKNAIPAKYGQVATSKLKATVKQESNTFDFKLED